MVASGSTASSSSFLELLLGSNHYLPHAPKELLWHHHLSHASLMTIHNLVYQTCPGSTPSSEDLIPPDQGSLLSCTFNVHYAVCDNLLCVAGENAKATGQFLLMRGPFLAALSSGFKNHLLTGDCISCGHNVSPPVGLCLILATLPLAICMVAAHFCLSCQWLNLPPRCSLNASETIYVKF